MIKYLKPDLAHINFSIVRSRGSVMIMVLTISAVMPVFFFAIHFFLRNQYRNVNRIQHRQILERALENHFELISAKIQQGRWYKELENNKWVRELDNGVVLTFWFDEYMCKEPRVFQKPVYKVTPVLDHVNIYGEARMGSDALLATGRILFSPEPVLEGKDVQASPWWSSDITTRALSVIRMVERRIWLKQRILQVNEDFEGFETIEQRQTFADYLEQSRRAGILKQSSQRKEIPGLRYLVGASGDAITKQRVDEMFSSWDSANGMSHDNVRMNLWVLNHMELFRHDQLWSRGELLQESRKRELLKAMGSGSKAEELSAEEKNVLKSMYEDYKDTAIQPEIRVGKEWFQVSGRTALQNYFSERNPDEHLQKNPLQFIDLTMRNISGYKYSFQWQAVCGQPQSNGSFKDYMRYKLQLENSPSSYPKNGCNEMSEVRVDSSAGPLPSYSEIQWRHPRLGRISLYAVARLYLKMATEAYSAPAELKKSDHPGGMAVVFH
jgi:hypothetical protein